MQDTIYLPKTKALVEKEKNKPTTEERIEALENALADLTIQTMGVNADD